MSHSFLALLGRAVHVLQIRTAKALNPILLNVVIL
jgi:hypothetical protein